VIYVTHELRDACAMGDRIAVISDGRIEQIGEPLAVIRRPATYDVARFVGVRNLFEGVVRAVDGGCVHVSIRTEPRAGTTGATDALEVMAAGGDALAVGDDALAAGGDAPTIGQRVHVCVRPEDFDVADPSRAGSSGSAGSTGVNAIRLTIRDRQLRGATYTLEGWAGGSDLLVEVEVSVRTYEALDLANRREVMVVVAPEAVHLIPDMRKECDDGRSTVV
jgi:ABC-type Fe3+/spermidine/putrescine transport system ATPase subunit